MVIRPSRPLTLLRKQQEQARQALESQYRAEHEILYKRIIATTERIRKSYSPHTRQRMLENSAINFKTVIIDMLGRQRLEASVLSAKQTAENHGKYVKPINVVFPYNCIFD